MTVTTKYAENLAKFELFHAENPHVADELEKLALRLMGRGTEVYSIAGLFEVLRFRRALRTTTGVNDNFKLCNNHKPFYARYLMKQNPQLDGFFVVKEQCTKGKVAFVESVYA